MHLGASPEDTWIGHTPVGISLESPARDEEERTERGVFLGPEEERTARGFFLAPVREASPSDDATTISGEGSLTYLAGDTDHAVFTRDMVEELRRRLREAEARESSGIRVRPTPEAGIARDVLEPLAAPDPCLEDADIEIEVDEPHTLEELDEVLSPLPELEVALAPNSESNFYAGFDEEHPDGVFLATYSHMLVGTPVYLTVQLPAGFRFRSPALVEWVRPPEAAAPGVPAGAGLKLCGLDHRTRRLIRSFAGHRRPLFYVG